MLTMLETRSRQQIMHLFVLEYGIKLIAGFSLGEDKTIALD